MRLCRSPWPEQLLLALLLLGPGMVSAAGLASPGAVQWTVQVDNDEFATPNRHDRWYTSGLRIDSLSLMPSAAEHTQRIRHWCARLTGCMADGVFRTRWSFGQDLYTQSERSRLMPAADERPLAGWLYLRGGVQIESPKRLDSLALEFGLTGPAALGRQTQNAMHSLLGVAKVPAWAYQTRPRAGLALELATTRRFRLTKHLDWLGHGALRLGTLRSALRAGAMLRIGPGLRGAGFPGEARDSLMAGEGPRQWWFFSGVSARFTAYDKLIEGPSYGQPHDVSARFGSGNVFAGLSLPVGKQLLLSLMLIRRSLDFRSVRYPDSHSSPQTIGSLRLSYRL